MLGRQSPVQGVTHATFGEPPAFARNAPRLRGVRGKGMKYEAQVQNYMRSRFGELYLPGPWIYFVDSQKRLRYCQPDGLLFDFEKGRITICEVKLRHTQQAWYQLYDIYKPLIQHMFPGHLWSIRCLEICRWYDMATAIPGPHQLRNRVEDCGTDIMGVHIYEGH